MTCHCCVLQKRLQAPLEVKTIFELIESFKRSRGQYGSQSYQQGILTLKLILNNLTLLMGHGIEYKDSILKKIPKIVDILMVRNYPELVKWKGIGKLAIFVPDHYLIKAPGQLGCGVSINIRVITSKSYLHT